MRAFELEIERPLDIARTHEIALLRKAVARDARSPDVRFKLAMLLFEQDGFDEVIALLDPLFSEFHDADLGWHLAEAHVARETPDDDLRAEQLAREALTLTDHPPLRARILATLGKVLTRQDRIAEARDALGAALEADPGERNAFKRLATLGLRTGTPEETLALTDRLLARGVGHSRLLGARALAFTRLGRMAEAREADGLDRFLHRRHLCAGPGWPDIAALNAAVRAELHRHPDLRFDRYGTASSKTWRIDEPAFADSVAIPALQALIRQAVIDHVATLTDGDAPWIDARPARATLHNWVVLTDAEGHEEWHVHQGGWLSGVYYIDVPTAVRDGDSQAGCIAFGLPEDQVGAVGARAFGETLVRPEPGLLMLFPSHCFHRTFPHGSDQRRICMAFDVQPA